MAKRPTILSVFGTRPEAIKIAPVVKAIEASNKLESRIAVTGQHREMLDQVTDLFGMRPDVDLNIMSTGQSLNEITSKVISGIDKIITKKPPAAVLVQGDTTTVMATAIAAFNQQVPVIHLEAGLRSGDILSPFPEEANRKITSQVSALHLAPTAEAQSNLLNEGVDRARIVVTGNTVIDALQMSIKHHLEPADASALTFVKSNRPKLLVTTHRRENLGTSMYNIGDALAEIARKKPELLVIFPMHRNPLVREAILPHIKDLSNVLVTEPLPYGEFSTVLNASDVVLTDSGGIQEEAPSLGKPVLVMRDNTERPEAVEAGTVRLIGTRKSSIVSNLMELLNNKILYQSMSRAINPYGDGKAAARAVSAIEHMLGLSQRMEEFTPDSTR